MLTSGVKTRAQTRRDSIKTKLTKAQAEECAICLDNMDDIRRSKLVVNKCGHTFHLACMARWNKQCKERSVVRTCPYCRKKL